MQDSFDITTIVFLALAVFVIWRLRSVLGQKTGNERPPYDPFARRDPPMKPGADARRGEDNVVRLPGAANDRATPAPAEQVVLADRWKGIAEPGSPVAAGLDGIARIESAFDARSFLDGAKMAYEMIVMSFASGDRKTLKNLLSKEVYEGFERAISERDRRGEKVETTFVSIDTADITHVELRGKTAQVTVRFLSKLITATRNATGAVVDGNPGEVVDVTDVWTFSRVLGSRDPNWQLVATESGQ
ncbi:Tim44/TimA family putative adaptor protein [Chelatococcus sp. SYSU_G07232]|uniref:Tim44/TimA family putative adaptor protein n=1 Tax=Chelatococcus albus TaxID=3047466 RepID=A0ABT7AHA1_9HYPH|nr:Tim44/TimA family putative adaptor protein [Chelatococcus sp. SYSU_G07232]MDJ1158723.1 Tim44/TimA family putative adaptor protein [Chelatococcus sp. SYSU_G07232]